MIVRLASIGALWLALGAAAAPRPSLGNASVEVSATADGGHATVTLDRPVGHFAFEKGDIAWDGQAEMLTPGLTLNGRTVTGAAPFRRFELRLRPTTEEHDGKYPVLYRLGDGAVLMAAALAADDRTAWRTRIRLAAGKGQVRYPAGREAVEGFVYIGPRNLVTADRTLVAVADPQVPAWIRQLARRDLEAGMAYYSTALGTRLPRRPVLLMKAQEDKRSSYVGDVTAGPVVALRFHGSNWAKPDPGAERTIHTFILHEVFHFWNGGLVTSSDGTPSWVHEGGAEYASLLAALHLGMMTEVEARRRLGDALTRCRLALQKNGDQALSKLAFLATDVRYPCGMVLQWAVDLEMRRAGRGRTVMDAWAATVAGARRRPGRTYTVTDFYKAAAIEPAGFAPAALMVDTAGPERWKALPRALSSLGADVGGEVTPSSRRLALLFHLLEESCGPPERSGGFGFFFDSKHIRLQTTASCGVLAGGLSLKSVEGGDPFAPSAETYAAVQRRCLAGAPVLLVTPEGRTIAAPCKKPLADAPPEFVVRRRLAA